jgi:hypothetical protein
MHLLGLSGIAANLGQQQVNTEGCVLVVQEALEFSNLLPQHVWRVADAANDTETASVGNGSGELRTGRDVHASKQNGVFDPQKLGRDRLDLFCILISHMYLVCCGEQRIKLTGRGHCGSGRSDGGYVWRECESVKGVRWVETAILILGGE